MQEQNLIVFFVDGSTKIFRGPMKIPENIDFNKYAVIINEDGAWSLNTDQIKYFCICSNEQLSKYLGSLDQSYIHFDTRPGSNE